MSASHLAVWVVPTRTCLVTGYMLSIENFTVYAPGGIAPIL
jgi:hypothetical protein